MPSDEAKTLHARIGKPADEAFKRSVREAIDTIIKNDADSKEQHLSALASACGCVLCQELLGMRSAIDRLAQMPEEA